MSSPVTTQWVINDIGDEFLNRTTFINKMDRSYDKEFQGRGVTAASGGKRGSLVQARLPQRFITGRGASLARQPFNDKTTPIEITDQLNIGIPLSSWDLTFSKAEIRKNLIIPAANALVQEMEALIAQRIYLKTPNSVGTLATSPTSNVTYQDAVAKLRDLTGDGGDLTAIISNDMMNKLVTANQSLPNSLSTIAEANRKNMFARNWMGVDEWYTSPNVPTHTTGTFTASTPLVNQAPTEGMSSVVTDGWASGASSLKEGDVLTFASCNEVNSANRRSTGRARQVTVTANVTDSTGAMTITFTPPLYSAGQQYANCDVLPADNAAITVWAANPAGGTLATTNSRQGLIFAPDAYALAMADAPQVDAPVCVFTRDEEAGISIRLTKSFGIENDQNDARLDLFFGVSPYRAEWTACRVQGA